MQSSKFFPAFALAASLLIPPNQLLGQSRNDSLLVAEILKAEDAGDSTSTALSEGERHPDIRIRAIAWRAAERIRDDLFSRRDSFPPSLAAAFDIPPSIVWPEPAWRLRFRELNGKGSNCSLVSQSLSDDSWPVRIRAMQIVDTSCINGDIERTLSTWISSLQSSNTARLQGNVSWHAAAHSLVALSRKGGAGVSARVSSLSKHPQPELRQYVARSATQLKDVKLLTSLVHDDDANVRSLAIEGLQRISGHASDSIYISALSDSSAQVVRSAARALKDSQFIGLSDLVLPIYNKWVDRQNDSEKDVRVAILAVLGQDADADEPPARIARVSPYAVQLALGEQVYLAVKMRSNSGGGEFVVKLRGDIAPLMASQILELSESGYYDGLKWQRVEHDFVIQGGSPGANEYVGYNRYLRDETATIPHLRGTVGMSTRGHDTGDAQWFVNLRDNARLNRDYTVFAEVVSGIEVVDDIMEGDIIESIRRISRP